MNDLDHAIDYAPDNGRAYSNRGACHLWRDNLSQADRRSESGPRGEVALRLRLCPARPSPFPGGDLARALVDLNRAVELKQELVPSQRAWAYAKRGTVYENLDERALDARDYREALEINPDHSVASAWQRRVEG
ncbi:tetratricopeptide repeat protein [Fodinicurvata sediminis]|uniref:tetratricopeptide repeat protein n=1 Tax=Fodinicurvata sediminis TaxID=1121832 RepID=UPI0003B60B67|nr:tetratricopeptide repeat protein [Fodinicurvata sediminis]